MIVDTNAAPVLRAEAVRYLIGAARLLDGVDVELRPGELVGLIGPNGAGKSTLLRTLIGYLRPTGGRVVLQGRPIASYSARDRAKRISYLSQYGPDQFPFPVVDVVEMGSYPVIGMGRAPGTGEREAALRALSYVGLEHLADRSFPSLSGGERQLVLFARVLVQESPIILLDEPTASLDIGHETTLLQMVRDLCEEGYSAIIALHNLNVAAEYCHRLVLMQDGRVRAEGPPDAVLTRDLVEESYHTAVHVGRNDSTGSIAVSPVPVGGAARGLRVHVIGGAGSGVNITRFLHRNGCGVTGGVAHELDSDARLWKALGIPFVQVPAFSSVGPDRLAEAAAMVDAAVITVLGAFPFGEGNAGNLELAARAKRLVILGDEPGGCARDFFADAEAMRARFERLAAHTGIVTYREACRLVEELLRKGTEHREDIQ
ncbi:MAG: ABC transporter ATP-binding protein [Spirochaetota bacterium]